MGRARVASGVGVQTLGASVVDAQGEGPPGRE